MKKSGVVSLILVLLCGCGYSTRSLLPAHLKTIAVPNFTNKTYEPGLEVDITKKVIDRYNFDGNLKIASEDRADMLLLGELVAYDRVPLRYNNNDNETVEEYRVVITVNLILKDLVKKKVMWEETNFKGEYSYYAEAASATGAVGTSARTEEDARKEAILDLARKIANRTVEMW